MRGVEAKQVVGFTLWMVATLAILGTWQGMGITGAEGSLLGYLPFQWAGRETSILTTVCPLAGTGYPIDLLPVSTGLTIVNTNWPSAPAGSKGILFPTYDPDVPANGSLALGNWKVYSDSRKMTVAFWTDAVVPKNPNFGEYETTLLLGRLATTDITFFDWYLSFSSYPNPTNEGPFYLSFNFKSKGNPVPFRVTNLVNVTNTGWKHIAFTVDLEDQLITFYINGVPSTTQFNDKLSGMTEQYGLYLGGPPPELDPSSYITLSGRMDEIYFYDEEVERGPGLGPHAKHEPAAHTGTVDHDATPVPGLLDGQHDRACRFLAAGTSDPRRPRRFARVLLGRVVGRWLPSGEHQQPQLLVARTDTLGDHHRLSPAARLAREGDLLRSCGKGHRQRRRQLADLCAASLFQLRRLPR